MYQVLLEAAAVEIALETAHRFVNASQSLIVDSFLHEISLRGVDLDYPLEVPA
jgi:hypothetical protein